MHWLRDVGLGIKVSLLMLLVLSVLLFSTIMLLNSNTQRLTQEVGSERIAEEVNIITRRLAEVERELSVDVNFVASSVTFFQAVGRRNQEDIIEIIERANVSLELDDIDVVDGDGKLLADIRADDLDDEKQPLLTEVLKGEEATSVLIETRDSNTQVNIAAAAPVVSITGNILGALQMSRLADETFLRELVFEREGVYLGGIYNDQIFARSTETTEESRSVTVLHSDLSFDAASVQLAENGQTVIAESLVTSGDVPYAVAYVPITPNETASSVVIMVLVELDELYAFQNTTLLNTIAVFVVLTVLTVGIIYFVFYQIAISPINRLKAIAQKMTSGQYDQRIPIAARDELGQLAVTFNELASAIQQRETNLQAARVQAERSDQVKSAFLASMSHELRTPLNAVINFTQFVIDGDTGEVNEQQIELLTEVVTSAKHLLNLINDVLDMSKIEAGSLKLFIEDNVSINALVNSVATTGRSLLANKPVRLQMEMDDDLPLIRGDRQRIVQILLNIMSNACKFVDQGEITVAAQRIDSEIKIAISDTGPGIPPEDHDLVFEAFKQTKTGLKHGGGTGLGMPIAKSLAEAHGGRLWFESQPGKGTTFYVSLPIISEQLVPTLAS